MLEDAVLEKNGKLFQRWKLEDAVQKEGTVWVGYANFSMDDVVADPENPRWHIWKGFDWENDDGVTNLERKWVQDNAFLETDAAA